MTRSIYEVLATLPSGAVSKPLGDADLARYLRTHYDTDAEKERNARHARRDVFYRDGGCEVMCKVIDDIFVDETVRRLRKKWVPYARFSNDIRRIVGDLSTVYAEPALRSVEGSDANKAAYQSLCDDVLLDEQMDYANRMVNLHRAILLGPRVRVDLDGRREMVIDVATPAVVRAVTHPLDASLVVAWLIKSETKLSSTPSHAVAWQLWSDHEVVDLDANFMPVGVPLLHELGMNRWIPLTFNATALPGFWPGEEGEDMVAAAISIWMAHILMLKETKSATTMPIISGDVSAASRGQAMDTEVPVVIPEGAAVQTVDMSMDTEIFTRAADHVLEKFGNGYGLSLASLKHQGAQSADAREIILEPLRVIRRKQIKFMRRFEARLAVVMAAVAARDLGGNRVFTADGWRIDFGEIQALTPKKQRMEEFIQAQQIGIDNVLAFAMRENPDLKSAGAARDWINQNIQIRTAIVEMMQEFMRISGASKAPDPVSNTAPHVPPPDDDLSWVQGVYDA